MMKTRMTSLAVTVALCSGLVSAPVALAQDTCQQGWVVSGGTLDWGIKDSWRKYIKGPIAKGAWTTDGAVTENGGIFKFRVDPAKSQIWVDGSGAITTANIATLPGQIHFTGHHGALDVKMSQPYLNVQSGRVGAGMHYETYYVPGKEMTTYTKEDKTPANRVTGHGVFAQGAANGSVDGNGKGVLAGSQMGYVVQPGTFYDPATQKGAVVGVDLMFIGNYQTGAPVDDVSVQLELTRGCVSEPSKAPELPKAPEPAPQITPAGGSSSIGVDEIKSVFNLLLTLATVGGFLAILAKVLGQNITLPKL